MNRNKTISKQNKENLPENQQTEILTTNSTSISIKHDLSMSKQKITNLGMPNYDEDLVTLGYLRSKFVDKQDKTTGYLSTEGGSMFGEINMGNHEITNVQFPIKEASIIKPIPPTKPKKNVPSTSDATKEMSDKEKRCAINAKAVKDTIKAIQSDSYLSQVDEVVKKLEKEVEELEKLFGVEKPPEPDPEPEQPEAANSNNQRIATYSKTIAYLTNLLNNTYSLRNKKLQFYQSSATTPTPTPSPESATQYYVEVIGDTMTGDLNMGGNSVRGLPMTPTKEQDAVSLGYLRSKYACGGCSMNGDIKITSDESTNTRVEVTNVGNVTNLKTPLAVETNYAANLEFIGQRLPGPKINFISIINESSTYILENEDFVWNTGTTNQSSDASKYVSVAGTYLELQQDALYTLHWTALVNINLPDNKDDTPPKDTLGNMEVLEKEAPEEPSPPPTQGLITLKLMAPEEPSPQPPSNGNGQKPPEPEPAAKILASYPIGPSPITISCQIPIPLNNNVSTAKENNDKKPFSLYLEFSTGVKVEYSCWNLLIRPFPRAVEASHNHPSQ